MAACGNVFDLGRFNGRLRIPKTSYSTSTGLKPAGIDYGPVIPAAEHAVETGDLAKLKAALMEKLEHALSERLAHVRELEKAPLEPKTAAEVPNSRERVSAELGFITFAESVHQALLGKGAEHHVD